ncbi:MAG: sulfatase-like hydrolase/transferase [Paludibacteraceae bacterium]|nr:sulfatase-like hydrolase/transferase [Paludibacteraceae bacterium]
MSVRKSVFDIFKNQERCNSICNLILLSVCVLIEIVLFNFSLFGLFVSGASGITYIHELFLFWVPKIAVAIFLASFMFVVDKKWIYGIIFIIDLWITANYLYNKSNDLFIDVVALKMTSNLFDPAVLSSTLPHIGHCLSYFAITLLFFVLSVVVDKHIKNNSPKSLKYFFLTFGFVLLLFFVKDLDAWRSHYIGHINGEEIEDEAALKKGGFFGVKWFIPFNIVAIYAEGNSFNDINSWQNHYIKDYSIIHYAPAIFVFDCLRPSDDELIVTEDEVEPFLNDKSSIEGKDSLNTVIIICVESLESWPIAETGQLAKSAPNLTKFIKHDHVYYCGKVKSQVKNGVSGDGQMIINTGLLPLHSGAACQLYGDNIFPNFAHFFDNSVIIAAWPRIWNQDVVTYTYGYKELIQPYEGKWNDEMAIDKTIQYVVDSDLSNPVCVFTITTSMHLPFKAEERHHKRYDSSIPDMAVDYLNCLSYTDACLGKLLKLIDTNPTFENASIIITGDHTVFRKGMMSKLKHIRGINKSVVGDNNTYCPLIIYSPKINGNIQDNRELYQLDIYPTLLNLLGINDYYWSGLGIDILNSQSKRIIEEDKAYNLSDRLIRTNYFAKKFGIKK